MELINKINNIPKEIKKLIDAKIKEFQQNKNLFSELCFCLLTSNFQAKKSIEIQKQLEKDFFNLPKEQLAEKLKKIGHRFWPQRAEYIVLARENKNLLCNLPKSSKEAREILVKNIKGFGMKESSHLLRNIGYKDVAIIDFHILDLLEKENLIKKPKILTPKKYLEIELILQQIAAQSKLNLAELDLYLWYLETGKVLK